MNIRKKNLLIKKKALLGSKFVVVLGWKSMNAEDTFEIKERLWNLGGNVNLVKNSIFKIAAAEHGCGFLSDVTSGSIAIAYCDGDICAFLKSILEIAKKYGESRLSVLSAKYCDEPLSKDLMSEIATLPSEDHIYLKLVNLLNSIPLLLARTVSMPASLLTMHMQNHSKESE